MTTPTKPLSERLPDHLGLGLGRIAFENIIAEVRALESARAEDAERIKALEKALRFARARIHTDLCSQNEPCGPEFMRPCVRECEDAWTAAHPDLSGAPVAGEGKEEIRSACAVTAPSGGERQRVVCPRCHGSGEFVYRGVPSDCALCHGSGDVTPRRAAAYEAGAGMFGALGPGCDLSSSGVAYRNAHQDPQCESRTQSGGQGSPSGNDCPDGGPGMGGASGREVRSGEEGGDATPPAPKQHWASCPQNVNLNHRCLCPSAQEVEAMQRAHANQPTPPAPDVTGAREAALAIVTGMAEEARRSFNDMRRATAYDARATGPAADMKARAEALEVAAERIRALAANRKE